MNLTESNACRLDEGHFEAGVVGDDANAFEQGEDASAGAVQVNDEDTIAAGVDLQKPDASAPRIETGIRSLIIAGYRR